MTLQQKIKNALNIGLVSLIGIVGCSQNENKTDFDLNKKSYGESPEGVVFWSTGMYNYEKRYNLIRIDYGVDLNNQDKKWSLVYDLNDPKSDGKYLERLLEGDTIKLDQEGYICEIKWGPRSSRGHESSL